MKDIPNVGQTPGENAKRDAIHVAVAPVVAAQDLSPGDHVWCLRRSDGMACYLSAYDTESIGIVDPFRTGSIKKGETFWLFLYPNTITSLRHVWSHPAFKVTPPKGETNE